jgi:hypothetical protein
LAACEEVPRVFGGADWKPRLPHPCRCPQRRFNECCCCSVLHTTPTIMSSHLSNDEVRIDYDYAIHRLIWEQFFTRLTSLLETRQQKGHGSIFLTQKRRAQTFLPYSRSTLTRPSDLRRVFCLHTRRLPSRRSRTSISTSTHPRSRDRWQLANKGPQEVGKDQAEHSRTT